METLHQISISLEGKLIIECEGGTLFQAGKRSDIGGTVGFNFHADPLVRIQEFDQRADIFLKERLAAGERNISDSAEPHRIENLFSDISEYGVSGWLTQSVSQ